jgi:hypothetical protein
MSVTGLPYPLLDWLPSAPAGCEMGLRLFFWRERAVSLALDHTCEDPVI